MKPNVTIDRITSESGGIHLYLLENDEWPESSAGLTARLNTIRDRIRGAIEVVRRGHLDRAYPIARGQDVQVVVASLLHGYPPALIALVREIDKELQDSVVPDGLGELAARIRVATNDDVRQQHARKLDP